jgi:hypothetical protein
VFCYYMGHVLFCYTNFDVWFSCGVVERMVVRLLSFIAGTRVSVCIIIALQATIHVF